MLKHILYYPEMDGGGNSNAVSGPKNWPYRSDSHKPLLVTPQYPGHAIEESTKLCATCNRRQKRLVAVVGPMTEADIGLLHVPKRGPKRSDHWLCQFILWRWLLAHPKDQCSPWFIIRARAECKKCDESHHEKEYARQFNRFRRILIHGQRVITELFPRVRFFSVE